MIALLFGLNLSAFSISHGSETISPTDSNFIFANTFWTKTEDDINFMGSHTNYLYFDVDTNGSFQMNTLNSKSTAIFNIYKLNGSSDNYKTELLKKISANSVDFAYLVKGTYLVEANFDNQAYPHLSFDFYPDGGDDSSCIPLNPEVTALTCGQQWLPAYYTKELHPWIQQQIQQLKYRMGNVGKEKEIEDYKNFAFDSMVDSYQIIEATNPTDIAEVLLKKSGQLVATELPDNTQLAGLTFDTGFAYDQMIQHALLFHHLLAVITTGGTPSDQLAVAQQLTADITSIVNNSKGLLDLMS